MKRIILISSFIFLSNFVFGQIECYFPCCDNNRPDTVKNYLFFNKSISVEKIPSSKPLSNYGFKTKKFTLEWRFFITTNSNRFISETCKHISFTGNVDTNSIKLLEDNYNSLIFFSKERNTIIMYQEKTGEQLMFICIIKQKKYIQKSLEFIKKYLNF